MSTRIRWLQALYLEYKRRIALADDASGAASAKIGKFQPAKSSGGGPPQHDPPADPRSCYIEIALGLLTIVRTHQSLIWAFAARTSHAF